MNDKPVTLPQCAEALALLNDEIQKQNSAYKYFTAARASVKDNNLAEQLPVLSFKLPGVAAMYELELDSLTETKILATLPLFDLLVDSAGDLLLASWKHLIELADRSWTEVKRIEAADSGG